MISTAFLLIIFVDTPVRFLLVSVSSARAVANWQESFALDLAYLIGYKILATVVNRGRSKLKGSNMKYLGADLLLQFCDNYVTNIGCLTTLNPLNSHEL